MSRISMIYEGRSLINHEKKDAFFTGFYVNLQSGLF